MLAFRGVSEENLLTLYDLVLGSFFDWNLGGHMSHNFPFDADGLIQS